MSALKKYEGKNACLTFTDLYNFVIATFFSNKYCRMNKTFLVAK